MSLEIKMIHNEHSGECEILVDTRKAERTLSASDIVELGQALTDRPSLHPSKIAVLLSVDGPKQADFLDKIPDNHTISAKVFTDFEEAINWLDAQEAG